MIKIKRLTDIPTPFPTRGSKFAAGLDLYSVVKQPILPGQVGLVRTGIAIEMPPGTFALCTGRSGMTCAGLSVQLGTIDQDYRGEISPMILNTRNFIQTIEIGQRIAQLIVMFGPIMYPLEEVDELSPTERGESGFGSSGK